MTKYTRFEAIFRNETLVFTDRDPKFRNRSAQSGSARSTESSSASMNPLFATKREG